MQMSPKIWTGRRSENATIVFGSNQTHRDGQIVRTTWFDVPSFLEKCNEFDGSEQTLTSISFEVLKPLFSSPLPEFRKIAEVLQLYNAARGIGGSNEKATCHPWTVPPIPSDPKIAMLMVAKQADDSAWQLSITDKKQYAKRHGYHFHVFNESIGERHAAWTKFPAALSLMDAYDWVFGIDLDTVILNHNIRLESFLDPSVNVILNIDMNGINTGVYFMKSCTWTKMLLIYAWTLSDVKNSGVFWEQAAIMHQMDNYMLRNRAKFIPQKFINEYPKDSGEPVSAEDAFIIHFAGRGDKMDQVKNYYSQRVGVVDESEEEGNDGNSEEFDAS